MSETPITPPSPSSTTPNVAAEEAEAQRKQRQIVVGGTIFAVLLLIGVVAAIYGLMLPGTPTDKIRDIFIIFMALESLIIGAALVVLIVQIATLINLLNNEIKPMLEATNETIANLRGTTEFLSENLVEPVVKLNSYVAGLQKMLDIFSLKK
jgi:amino acid permease